MKKLTTEEFINRAKQVHGDKYDYSKVEYVNSSTKICIICPIHGPFWQIPGNHLFGQGCKKCGYKKNADKRRKSKNDFIKESKQIHGDKYDYSKVEYINSDTKVCIICPIHGPFWQIPYNHLIGNGCPKCVGQNKTTESFVEESKQVHGDKYDYSKVEYKGAFEKVCIICPIHGPFWQTPSSHLFGNGCPKCVGKNKTTESFIKELKQVHGNKYDYSKVEYKGAFEKVHIICPIHGEFFSTPHSILNKNCGCPKCGKIQQSQKQKLTTEEFINRAKQVHGDKYDYSKVEYINAKTKVHIICPIHGPFWQTPNAHISKYAGCPKCKESYLETQIRVLLEKYNINYIQEYFTDWLYTSKCGIQKIDFFLPDFDICIECQGIQHFVPLKLFKTNYDKQIQLDILKFEKCKQHNKKIIYYTKKDYLKYINNVYIYDNNVYDNDSILTFIKKLI